MSGKDDQSETKPREDDALALDQQLCFAVYSAAHALNRTYKPLLDPYGLTYPQYLVLMALWEEDGRTVKALGRALGLDSGTLSPLLKRLEASGFITRNRDRADERQVLIALTDKGRAMRSGAEALRTEIGRASGCTLPVLEALTRELQVLTGNLKAGHAADGETA